MDARAEERRNGEELGGSAVITNLITTVISGTRILRDSVQRARIICGRRGQETGTFLLGVSCSRARARVRACVRASRARRNRA